MRGVRILIYMLLTTASASAQTFYNFSALETVSFSGLYDGHVNTGYAGSSLQTTNKCTGVGGFQSSLTTTAVEALEMGGITATGLGTALAVDELYFYGKFYITTAPAANSEEMAGFRTASVNHALRLTSARTIALYRNDTTLVTTGSTVLPLTTCVGIAWYLHNGASGAYELKICTPVCVTEFSGTADFGAPQLTHAWVSKRTNRNGQSIQWTWDDFAIADGWIHGLKVLNLIPNAAGNYTDWADGTGTTFAEVDDWAAATITDGSTTTIKEASPTGTHSFNVTAPTGVSGSIRAVKSIVGVRADTNPTTVQSGVRSGTTDLLSTAVNFDATTYTIQNRIFPTDPATSTAWTTGSLAGVEVVVAKTANNVPRVSAMGLSVAFDDTPGGLPVFYKDLGGF